MLFGSQLIDATCRCTSCTVRTLAYVPVDGPDFSRWATEHKLTTATVARLQEEDLNSLETLALLELRMLTLLSLTIGQRALLTEAVMTLKSKRSHIYIFFCKFYD